MTSVPEDEVFTKRRVGKISKSSQPRKTMVWIMWS